MAAGNILFLLVVLTVASCYVGAAPQLRVLNASPPWWGSITNDMQVDVAEETLFVLVTAGAVSQYEAVPTGYQLVTVKQQTVGATIFSEKFLFEEGKSYTLWFVTKTDGMGGTAYEAGLSSENDQVIPGDGARVSLLHIGCTTHPLLGGCGEENVFLDMHLQGPTDQSAPFVATNVKATKVVNDGAYIVKIRHASSNIPIISSPSVTFGPGEFWSVFLFDHSFLRNGSEPCLVIVPEYGHGDFDSPGPCEQGDEVAAVPTDVYSISDNSTLRNCDTGCAGGPSAVAGLENHPNITACAGVFTGYVGGPSAQSLCARSWHVCSQTSATDRALLKQVTYEESADEFDGCYTYDAAHDYDTCRPCTGNIHEDDMAGMGRDCKSHNPNGIHGVTHLRDPGCTKSGRVDYCCEGYKESKGCQYVQNYTSGVVCCADNAENPCFDGQCPNDCCGNGLCDRSFGTCSCLPGFSGEDCCTECGKLTCEDCFNSSVCGWCANTQECVDISSTTCFEFAESCPVILKEEEDDGTINGVPIGGVIGAAIGGLAVTILVVGGILGFFLYKKFAVGEYAAMWEDMFSKNAHTSSLYEGNTTEISSGLYTGQ
ncbi:Tenascin [Balamuthia mandrillaris]